MSEVKDVRATLELLKELQAVDDRLAAMQQTMAQLSTGVNTGKLYVDELTNRMNEEKTELKNLERRASERELQMRSQQDKIERFRAQVNTAKTQKEYNALVHEISGAEADASRAEDEALRMMTKMDELKEHMQQLQRELAQAQEGVDREQKEAGEQARQYSQEARELMTERNALRSRLEDEIVKQYDRVHHGRQGRVVVKVVEQTCQGCHMGVTKQLMTRLMGRRDLVYCPNCARIIYLETSE